MDHPVAGLGHLESEGAARGVVRIQVGGRGDVTHGSASRCPRVSVNAPVPCPALELVVEYSLSLGNRGKETRARNNQASNSLFGSGRHLKGGGGAGLTGC